MKVLAFGASNSVHIINKKLATYATTFFEKVPNIYEKLVTLQEVGLGYIKIGQSATTLSGGEAQRVKLASFLNKNHHNKEEHILFIFDEPTTGLHFEDVRKLLEVLHQHPSLRLHLVRYWLLLEFYWLY